ncbi:MULTISPECIES: YjbH domain-containing protein [unclassified Vibrio]|uniref:YjbH domain-containing protein n=1 Tax=Vibrio sp. HB236076 TaxID=3232307 RepID=A0AB39HDW7_9VIBR|nr:YjbH domain-containing protein [Vibrio sp. HB161653]MDP5255392.1 YjbH domain-containing protein [Vibrio sp. HB161653]
MRKALPYLPFILLSSFSYADVESLPSNQAFTGLVLTPNAQVTDTGNLSFYYGQGVPYQGQISTLDTLNFTLGVFSGLEANGRVVTKTYDNNLFTDPDGGLRDLSISFKYQLPNFYQVDGLHFALGVQDFEGALNFFETRYAVADYEWQAIPLRMSLGYGQSDMTTGTMDGAFGGLEYQPWSFLQLSAEYDAVETNASVKLFTPDELMPWDLKASLAYQLYSSYDNSEQDLWLAQLAMPLWSDYTSRPTSLKDNHTLEEKIAIAQHGAESASITALQQALIQEGFVNVRVGKKNNQLIIALENRRYYRNQVDGFGVALGLISSHFGAQAVNDLQLGNDTFQLVNLNNGIATSVIEVSSRCYREFIHSGQPCRGLSFDTQFSSNPFTDTQWLTERQRAGLGRSQVIISPSTRYAIATEYGVLDYSLALATNLYTPLWPGFALDIRHFTPLDNSDDYQGDGYYADGQFENQVDRVLIHQAWRWPWGIMSQLSGGKVLNDYYGFKYQGMWFSPSGRHAFGAEYSHFSHRDHDDEEAKTPALASYLYSIPKWDWQLRVRGGEYWQGDQGFDITTNHRFGDVNVYASYLSSTPKDGDDNEQFLSLGIEFPFNFWRSMSPGYVQLRGIDQYRLNIQTRIGDDQNLLNTGLGGDLTFQHNVERTYFNRARYGEQYFLNHTQRLRNAYLRYIDEVN